MSTNLTTRLRSWLLVVGAAIGEASLSLFVGLAVRMNAVGYWFSDRIAFRESHARPLIEAPELPVPRLHLIDEEQPSAFATGANPVTRPWRPRTGCSPGSQATMSPGAGTQSWPPRHARKSRRDRAPNRTQPG
jgi:Zn-dependent protease with chaperone function